MVAIFQPNGRLFVLFTLFFALMVSSRALAAEPGFLPQARLGFTPGDQWEPAIAADEYGHVYVLYPQYGAVPGCQSCALPTMMLVVSADNGLTWQAPRAITPHTTGQFDAQIVVDPADHRTVYAAWLQNNNMDAVVAKSVDFGQGWSVVIADRGSEDADKPILAVRGRDVYVAFNRLHRIRVASSHDGGITFSSINVNPALALMRALAGGATVDPDENAFVAWVGYTARDGASGRVNLYTSKSTDGGKSWTTTLMDSSGAPPGCAVFHCEWGYLGAQVTMASDDAGTLYALWNSSGGDRVSARVYFASSTTAGETWSAKTEVSGARRGAEHAFPALVAGAAGDVRIGWMDTRNSPLWNVYYRSSTNGGATWSPESRLSSFVPGYRYIRSKGFSFPFGDYFGIAIDTEGNTQAVWGEGLNFRTPGSIWYTNGR
ncbi:MAG TPA: sialidase family protein [Terriglobales bacterium]|nr:sialidase family protein [Terriglobales bacterium]